MLERAGSIWHDGAGVIGARLFAVRSVELFIGVCAALAGRIEPTPNAGEAYAARVD